MSLNIHTMPRVNYREEIVVTKEPRVASELYKMLLKSGCIKFGVFKREKGKLSSYSLDLKLIPSIPNGMDRVVLILENMTRNEIGVESFDRIAGVPSTGITFASILSYKLSKPFLYIKGATETRGREKRIDGLLSPGDRILIVDDLIASGKSLLHAVDIVRGEGGMVSDALVLVDREEGGVEKLSKVAVKLHTFAKISEIVTKLHEANLIDKKYYEEVVGKGASKEFDSQNTTISPDESYS